MRQKHARAETWLTSIRHRPRSFRNFPALALPTQIELWSGEMRTEDSLPLISFLKLKVLAKRGWPVLSRLLRYRAVGNFTKASRFTVFNHKRIVYFSGLMHYGTKSA